MKQNNDLIHKKNLNILVIFKQATLLCTLGTDSLKRYVNQSGVILCQVIWESRSFYVHIYGVIF